MTGEGNTLRIKMQSRNLRVLVARSFLYGLQTNMVRAIWQPFVLQLGASMPFLGLLESIGGFGGLVSTAMLPVGGWLSDRHGRKAFVILASVFALLALTFYVWAGLAWQWWLLLPGVILLGLAAIARPALDCIIAESATPAAIGRAFSLTSVAFAISGILAPTLGGWLAKRQGYLAPLLLGGVLELGALLFVSIFLHETHRPQQICDSRTASLVNTLKHVFDPPPYLRSFYIASTIDLFAFGLGSAILFGLLHEEFGFTPLQLGLMSSAQSAVWAVSQVSVGRQVDRRGSVRFLALSEGIAVVVLVGWLFAKSYPAFLVLYAIMGLSVATWGPAYMRWITNSVPEAQRAEEMGRLGAFRGLLSFPASYIGGLLYTWVGFKGPILANLVGAFAVTLVFWYLVPEPQGTAISDQD